MGRRLRASGTSVAFPLGFETRCGRSSGVSVLLCLGQKFQDPLAPGVIFHFAQQLPVALNVLTPDETIHGRSPGLRTLTFTRPAAPRAKCSNSKSRLSVPSEHIENKAPVLIRGRAPRPIGKEVHSDRARGSGKPRSADAFSDLVADPRSQHSSGRPHSISGASSLMALPLRGPTECSGRERTVKLNCVM
jgi:hypothetical protein